MAARIAMIAITTSSSIKVNPLRRISTSPLIAGSGPHPTPMEGTHGPPFVWIFGPFEKTAIL
jgi:hypothetical protein